MAANKAQVQFEEHSDSEGELYDDDREEGEIDEEDEDEIQVPDIQDVLQKHGSKWKLLYNALVNMLKSKDLGLSNVDKSAQLAFYEWMYEHAYLATHYPLAE
jgi:hypothetical protein